MNDKSQNQGLDISLVTIDELAEMLRVPKKSIYYWCHRHEIPFLKMGKHLRFNPKEVLEYFERKTAENNPRERALRWKHP